MNRLALSTLLVTAVAAAVLLALNRPTTEASPHPVITTTDSDSGDNTSELSAPEPVPKATRTPTATGTPAPTPTAPPSASPTLTATPNPTPSPTPTPPPHGQILGCPLPGKWSLAYYNGPGASVDDVQGTCPFGIDAAYRIDPDTQLWSRYFRQRPEISNLGRLWNLQGVILLGSTSLHAASADQAMQQQVTQMYDCPRPDRWAISVWTGDPSAAIEQALATCSTEVAAAYWIDPYSQTWRRYFAVKPDISDLKTAAGHAFLTLGSSP